MLVQQITIDNKTKDGEKIPGMKGILDMALAFTVHLVLVNPKVFINGTKNKLPNTRTGTQMFVMFGCQ